MAREGYGATIHLLNGRVFEVIVDCTHEKEGLLYFMGEDNSDEDEYDDEESENWNSFLRIPIANIEYIEEEPIRRLAREEDYGIINNKVKKISRTQVKPENGNNRLQEIE